MTFSTIQSFKAPAKKWWHIQNFTEITKYPKIKDKMKNNYFR